MPELSLIADVVYAGDAATVAQLVNEAVEQNQGAALILNDGLIAGIGRVGEDFKNGDLFVPEVMMAAKAMTSGLEILEPLLVEANHQYIGTAIIGTVKGDLHDIGKNLVSMMLRGNGFTVIDLGTNVTAEKFIEKAKEHNAELICLSALLTTTMRYMKTVIKARNEAGINARIMIGGAPVTQEYADLIQADGYSTDAAHAVDVAKSLIGA